MPVEPNATDSASVARPSEGQQSSVRRQNGSAPVHARELSDDANFGRGNYAGGDGKLREDLAKARDESKHLLRKVVGMEEHIKRLQGQLDAERGLQDEQRLAGRYWRQNYNILFRIISSMPSLENDPAVAWLNEIVHTRFSKLL